MDYYDEDPRPRFQVQKSRTPISQNLKKPDEIDKKQAVFCITIGILIFSYGCLLPGIWQILLTWIGISMVLGSLAPISVTGGDCTVGVGDPIEDQQESEIEPPKEDFERKNLRSKARRSEYHNAVKPISNGSEEHTRSRTLEKNSSSSGGSRVAVVSEDSRVSKASEDSRVSRVLSNEEWSAEEVELLKKQLAKNPPGKPGRWEAIAEAFGGSITVECIIKKAKSLGEKKPVDDDSYSKFLEHRKVLDRPVLSEPDKAPILEEKMGWSDVEDKALLNALKAFPKDTNMRWDKIAAAVPGKSKTQCMKRFSELKQNFRSSKASET
ncbi:hypothetical protein SUGI_0900990 [Cryptomeria japonica]|uniref:transcription factor MAMYB n=1 Tax=Cryptomeria japonica TaxID=3369 RepID=UPI002414826A|nr:transcription factor MAMYB [Cryptomeria japonica]GLJ43373.1 hypothetical protein SUGI_0900990 [Cryptomeria japonica]